MNSMSWYSVLPPPTLQIKLTVIFFWAKSVWIFNVNNSNQGQKAWCQLRQDYFTGYDQTENCLIFIQMGEKDRLNQLKRWLKCASHDIIQDNVIPFSSRLIPIKITLSFILLKVYFNKLFIILNLHLL